MSQEWSAPKGYEITTQQELDELVHDENIRTVVDPIVAIANDSFELHCTSRLGDPEARARYIGEIAREGLAYGQWFHYPWDGTLTRFPDGDEWYNLRTFRNRNLITEGEQQVLRRKKIAAFGLSVGSKAVEEMVQTGIGDEYYLFDFDRLNPTNLNRIRAKMSQVGLLKTTVAGQKISELDPYINQAHFEEGYVAGKTDDILRTWRPDAIIEEVDDLGAKVALRRITEELKIPLFMAGDSADKSVLGFERHDKEKVKPFNGKVPTKMVEKILDNGISDADKETALIKILGIPNISPRLLLSAIQKARGELAGFPQLGTTATAGGTLVTLGVRDTFLGREVTSNAHVYDPRKIIRQKLPTTFRENVQIILDFLAYRREQAKKKGRE